MRTLLIGFKKQKITGYGHLDWKDWYHLTGVNIADYDDVIVNLIPVGQVPYQYGVDWGEFYKVWFHPSKVFELLHNKGLIVFVGDPSFYLEPEPQDPPPPFPFGKVRSRWDEVLHIEFTWDLAGGSEFSLEPGHEQFADYFANLKRWTVALQHWQVKWNRYMTGEGDNDIPQFIFEQENISVTKSQRAVAFLLVLVELSHKMMGSGELGAMMFLPDPLVSESVLAETVLRAIREPSATAPPGWSEAVMAPRQEALDESIGLLLDKRGKLDEELRVLEAERSDRRQFISLLYQAGPSLEKIVWRALRALGGEVEEPEDEGHEDGWVTYKGMDGVLEIKGTSGDSHAEAGLNQLGVWLLRGKEIRGKKYKGIFIGCAQTGLPLEERGDPFSSGFVIKAELHDAVVLRCEDLLQLVIANDLGVLNLDEFWATLFKTMGVFDASSVLPPVSGPGEEER